jgi:hypothetical protein
MSGERASTHALALRVANQLRACAAGCERVGLGDTEADVYWACAWADGVRGILVCSSEARELLRRLEVDIANRHTEGEVTGG